MAAALLTISSVGGGAARLISILPREAVSLRELVCPCVFDLGVLEDGETGLIVDQNGEDQAAFVQIDGSTVRLANSKAFRFQCKRREEVVASWKEKDMTIRVKLKVDGPGEEACFLRGSLTVTKGSRTEKRQIVGGCGC